MGAAVAGGRRRAVTLAARRQAWRRIRARVEAGECVEVETRVRATVGRA